MWVMALTNVKDQQHVYRKEGDGPFEVSAALGAAWVEKGLVVEVEDSSAAAPTTPPSSKAKAADDRPEGKPAEKPATKRGRKSGGK